MSIDIGEKHEMKMLYVLNTTGRVNNFSYSSMLAAKRLGIEFHIAGNWTRYSNSIEVQEDERKYGITIHQVDFIRNPFDIRNIRAYSQVIDLINKEKYDLIHCNTPIGGVIGRLAGKKCKVQKIIYQAHGFHFYSGAPLLNWLIYYPIEKILAHITDELITINNEDYDLANSFKLKKNGKVFYVPGVGIDISKYMNFAKTYDNSLREKNGIKDDDFVLISVGELNRNKNNRIIIEAMNLAQDSRIHYLVCGEGPEKEHLQKLADKYHMSNNVHFLGYRNDIEDLLNVSDVFVMPSLREGLSRSIMEAMAAGKPCIVSDIRGNRDLIYNGKGGILCTATDGKMFSDAIIKLVRNKKLASDMGAYNKEKVLNFETARVIDKIELIYKETFNLN